MIGAPVPGGPPVPDPSEPDPDRTPAGGPQTGRELLVCPRCHHAAVRLRARIRFGREVLDELGCSRCSLVRIVYLLEDPPEDAPA